MAGGSAAVSKVGASTAPEASAEEEQFKPGARVRVDGLSSNVEYNGTLATVKKWNEKHSRWEIIMDLDSKTKAMGNKNITMVGVDQTPNPNHKLPSASAATAASAKGASPGPDNANGFATGVRVRLQNLGSLPEYNGTLGTITGWDTTHERWKVKCDFDGKTKALLDKNMVLVESGASGAAASADA